jgi:hypothetical protein
LKKHGAKWIDELPCALWDNRTSASQATGEMPFFLVYRVDAIIPLEDTIISPCVQAYDEVAQDQLRRDDIDLIDKRR